MDLIYMFCAVFIIVVPLKISNIIYIRKGKKQKTVNKKINLMSDKVSYKEFLKVSEETLKYL